MRRSDSRYAVAADTFSVFGTTATLLVTHADALPAARAIADTELAAVDLACSRFRPDSELAALNAADGAALQISGLFAELLDAALRAARLTDGDVDPTCGRALTDIGYDRDFSQLKAAARAAAGEGKAAQPPAAEPGQPQKLATAAPQELAGPARRVAGWRSVRLDRARLTAQLTVGAQLDLGATAKAWAADHCASLIAARTQSGVLVSLGGDISVAGPAPAGGWRVRVADDHAAGPEEPGQTVTITAGGLATSSTTVRTWSLGGRRMHHIIDPTTGRPARSCWRTVTVAADTCADANTASTAAIVRGAAALGWLAEAGLPARLVAHDGTVETTAGWPASASPAGVA